MGLSGIPAVNSDHRMSGSERGLDRLQELLDELPDDDPTCRDAWCGWWERNNGEYERHSAHHDDLATGGLISKEKSEAIGRSLGRAGCVIRCDL
jgi:hypothetical protein